MVWLHKMDKVSIRAAAHKAFAPSLPYVFTHFLTRKRVPESPPVAPAQAFASCAKHRRRRHLTVWRLETIGCNMNLHLKPYTRNQKTLTPQILHPKPETPNPKPQTPNPKPQAPNPEPQPRGKMASRTYNPRLRLRVVESWCWYTRIRRAVQVHPPNLTHQMQSK